MNLYTKTIGLMAGALLVACSSTPKLSNVSPAKVNLSGDWVLNEALSQTVILNMPTVKTPRSRDGKKGPPSGGRGGKGGKGGVKDGDVKNGDSRPFDKPASMSAKHIKIDQGIDGMGVLYSGKPYRDVDWGEVEVRRYIVTSGWNGNKLFIHTKGKRQEYTEIYGINSDANILTVTFLVDSVDGKQEFVRVYNLKVEG